MVATIELEMSARRPCEPLPPLMALAGSPSTLRLVDAPRPGGDWRIDAVRLSVTTPDGTVRGATATADGDAWLVTVPGCDTPGTVQAGWTVYADGVDERGVAFTALALGRGDVCILASDGAITPGETAHYMRLVYGETRPASPREGDTWHGADGWEIYSGGAWTPLGGGANDDSVTRTSANAVKSSGIWGAIWGALAALPTGFSSLYGWCVAQFAKYLPLSGGTMTGVLFFGDVEGECGFVSGSEIGLFDNRLGATDSVSIQRTGILVRRYGVVLAYPARSGTFAILSDIPYTLHTAEGAAGVLPTGYTVWNDTDQVTDYQITITHEFSDGDRFGLFGGGTELLSWTLNGVFIGGLGTAYVKDAGGDAVANPQLILTAYSLKDRACNRIPLTSAQTSIELVFPDNTETPTRLRDFEVRLEVASGGVAPQITLPQGVVCENRAGAMPDIGGSEKNTLLYFSETAANTFLLKGEVVKVVA